MSEVVNESEFLSLNSSVKSVSSTIYVLVIVFLFLLLMVSFFQNNELRSQMQVQHDVDVKFAVTEYTYGALFYNYLVYSTNINFEDQKFSDEFPKYLQRYVALASRLDDNKVLYVVGKLNSCTNDSNGNVNSCQQYLSALDSYFRQNLDKHYENDVVFQKINDLNVEK